MCAIIRKWFPPSRRAAARPGMTDNSRLPALPGAFFLGCLLGGFAHRALRTSLLPFGGRRLALRRLLAACFGRSGIHLEHRLARDRMGHAKAAPQVLQAVAETIQQRDHARSCSGDMIEGFPFADHAIGIVARFDQGDPLRSGKAFLSRLAMGVEEFLVPTWLDPKT